MGYYDVLRVGDGHLHAVQLQVCAGQYYYIVDTLWNLQNHLQYLFCYDKVNGYCLIVCMETEAFSVYIQSTAAGLIEGFGLYGAFFAPLVV